MATSHSTVSRRQKLALIIGNNDYARPENRLRHCANDAMDLTDVLKSMSFTVIVKTNLTNKQMVDVISEFLRIIKDGDLVLFYFSGHGYQVREHNYLMPIDDAAIETEEDVEDHAVPVERILNRIAKRNPTHVTIFILDCCRRYWSKNASKTKGTTDGGGMNYFNPIAGTIIKFSCGINTTASDGLETERNGLFTKHLLRHIASKNTDIIQIFQRVAADVYKESNKKQQPQSINGLIGYGHVYLNELADDRPSPSIKSIDNYDNTNLEIFRLIWLDENHREHREIEQQLRSIINYLKKFQDVKQCQQYIEQRSERDRLIMIVSGGLGRSIVSSIHKLRQLISIYIYCLDKESNKQWSAKYIKVKGVVYFDELVQKISEDYGKMRKIEEPFVYNTLNTNHDGDKLISRSNREFLLKQILLDCLPNLKFDDMDKNELYNIYEYEYEGNQIELENLRRFRRDYSPEKISQWYLKNTFFSKILNGILCKQNIHMIILFRSFIFDIYRQLQRCQFKFATKFYRILKMSNDELKILRKRINQFISINSFFSTNTNRDQILSYLDTSDDAERVLFEIFADPKLVTTKPFATIGRHPTYPNEIEVLFMIGSIFRIENFNFNLENNLWIIQMTLCNGNEQEIKEVLMPIKQEMLDKEINFQIIGKILSNMEKYDLAERYFLRFLRELSLNDPLLIQIYKDLADVTYKQGNHEMSSEWLQKYLKLEKQNEPPAKSDNHVIKQIKQIRWRSHGITVAGGHGQGEQLTQLFRPRGIFVDNDKSVYIVDTSNHRIIQWRQNKKRGHIIAGGNRKGHRNDQLNQPTNLIIDRQNKSVIIADLWNNRLVRWSLEKKAFEKILIPNIHCWGLTIDEHGFLYIVDEEKNEVRKWKEGEPYSTVVAGGNGRGNRRNQLNGPTFIFVDGESSIYISDWGNHRVMKWITNAKVGIIVAGGNGRGNSLRQLSNPQGVIVDHSGQIYVADSGNDRVMRWIEGEEEGSIIVGGNGKGIESNQLSHPTGLSFDLKGNLYVADYWNHRIQKFELISK